MDGTLLILRHSTRPRATGGILSPGPFRRMPLNPRHDVHLEFTSAFEMLDFVQVVSEHMGRSVGLDEDARHWVGVAVRESVINAIKHGNRNDASKRVFVDFEATPQAAPELTIRVRDQGEGFDPEELADPPGAGKPPESERPRHLSHSQLHGRGAAAARAGRRHGDPDDQERVSFRSDRRLGRLSCLATRFFSPRPSKPSSAPAICRWSASAAILRVDKKGTIDLVTDVDVAVERMFRELVAERFPDHQVLAEELGGEAAAPPGPCWVFDPIDGTTNFAHGLPIFCSSLALEIDGVAEVAAVYDPNRRELFTAERGGGAFLNGRPLRVSATETLVDAMLVTGFPYDVHSTDRGNRRPVRCVRRPCARGQTSRVGGHRSLLHRRRAHGRILGERPETLGHRRRRADRRRGRRTRDEHGRERVRVARRATCWPPTGSSTTRCSRWSAPSGVA